MESRHAPGAGAQNQGRTALLRESDSAVGADAERWSAPFFARREYAAAFPEVRRQRTIGGVIPLFSRTLRDGLLRRWASRGVWFSSGREMGVQLCIGGPGSLPLARADSLSAGAWIEEPGHPGHVAVVLDQVAYALVPVGAGQVGYLALRNGGYGQTANATMLTPLNVVMTEELPDDLLLADGTSAILTAQDPMTYLRAG